MDDAEYNEAMEKRHRATMAQLEVARRFGEVALESQRRMAWRQYACAARASAPAVSVETVAARADELLALEEGRFGKIESW